MGKKPKLPPILKLIKEYKPQEMDYSYQKSISYTAFSTYMSCPKKWSLLYKDGYYESSFSMNMTFGTALHETVQNYLTLMYEKSGAEADRLDIEEYFQTQFTQAYQVDFEKNNKKHFSNPGEMREFFDDGINILTQLKQHKNKYFSKRDWHLVGCEIPILITPYKPFKNVVYKGYIDLVLYHEKTNKFVIYDLKTSKGSWGDYQKKDEIKIAQLLLYKHFFSQQFNIPIEDIDIEFFILKRKLPEENPYYLKHIQQFNPPSGKNKVGKAITALENFIKECFDENGLKDKEHEAKPSEYGCKYCVFSGKKDLCKVGIS